MGMVKFLSRSGSRSGHGEVKHGGQTKKSFKNAKNQYITVFKGGGHESGLNSDVSRLRSRSRLGQGHGKVKATNHCKLYTERKLMTWRMLWGNFYRGQGQGQVTVRSN